MKKVVSFVICALFVVVLLTPLVGCKKTHFEGDYTVDSLYCMGMTATKNSFMKYEANRTNSDLNYNSLYRPMRLLFNMVITIEEDGRAKLVVNDFVSHLNGDSHYSKALSSAQDKGYIENGKLVIENLKWTVDKSQSNSYYIFPIDDGGQKMKLSEIWGDKLFSVNYIHARIEKGKLACKLKVCIYETDESEKSTAALTTNVTITMNNK